jgi:hypothetical protein
VQKKFFAEGQGESTRQRGALLRAKERALGKKITKKKEKKNSLPSA